MGIRSGIAWRSKLCELWAIDPRALLVFRVGMGLMLLLDLAKRALSFREHYTADGMFPLEAAKVLEPDSVFFRIYVQSDQPLVQACLFAVAAFLAIFLLLGYRTRLVSILSFIMLVSLVWRNPFCTHTGDILLQAMTLWSCFLPLGSVASLDLRSGRTSRLQRPLVSIGSVAVFMQLIAFYFFAGYFKHRYDVWLRGDALWVFTNIEEYTRPFGLFLKDYPLPCKVLTYFTLVLEVGAPLLLFSPWRTGVLRTLAVLLLIGFHLGIQLTVYIGIFEILSIVSVILFLPPVAWDWIQARLPKGWELSGAQKTQDASVESPTAAARGPVAGTQLVLSWWFGRITCAACLVLMWIGNINSARDEPLPLPKLVHDYGKQLALLQNWNVFSDIENTFYGWFLVLGQLEDGRFVDVLEDREFAEVERPAHFASSFVNHNSRRFWRGDGSRTECLVAQRRGALPRGVMEPDSRCSAPSPAGLPRGQCSGT